MKQQQIKKTIAKLREVINIHENLQKLIPKRGGVKGSLGFLKAEQWQNRRRQQENKSKTAADFGFLSNSRKTFRKRHKGDGAILESFFYWSFIFCVRDAKEKC